MVILNRGLSVLGLLLLFTAAAAGQSVLEGFCKQVGDSVVRELKPTKIDRQEVYSNECVFEFTVVKGVEVTLRITKYDTEEESHESLQGWLCDVDLRPRVEGIEEVPLAKLGTKHGWDEVYLAKAGEMNSGFVLLRRGKLAITMLSLEDNLLIRVEKVLRDEPNLKSH